MTLLYRVKAMPPLITEARLDELMGESISTSALARKIEAEVRAALAQRQQVPMAPAMNIAGAASLPPSVGSGWVAACGCGGSDKYVDGKLVRSEYKCAAHAAAPQAAEPSRSQKMRAAGFTARDKRLTCDECGAKFTAQFAPLHECAPQAAQAQPQEPPRSAPLAEDPHREHWAAIARAAEAIGASANCGPEQAAEFCRAIDRLSAARRGEDDA